MMDDNFIADLSARMDSAIESFKKNLSGLRTGRASTALLENVKVSVYGASMPINQVGSVNVSDARTLVVQVWDGGVVNAVIKGIQESGLGLNPSAEGQLIRIILPDLSMQRRDELKKKSAEYAENAKIAVRNIRRDGNDYFKKQEKNMSEDDVKKNMDEVQKLTDSFIASVDVILSDKIKDISTF